MVNYSILHSKSMAFSIHEAIGSLLLKGQLLHPAHLADPPPPPTHTPLEGM